MRLIAHLTCFFLANSLCETVHAQSANNPLRSFFETRLSDKPDVKAPSYEKLLEVIDSIKSADPNAIQGALPAINLAAKSKTPNLAVEAVFAFHAISRRPDAGQLLVGSIPLLMNLLASNDERARNGSAVAMRTLSHRIPEATIPSMTSVLGKSGYSPGVKSEVFRAILDSKFRTDPNIIRSLESYIHSSSDVDVLRETLYAIAASRYSSPGSIDLALRSLESSNEPLQISAIHASYAMGNEARNRAQPIWARLATNTTKGDALRYVADQALRGTLTQPGKIPEAKSPPRLQDLQ